MNITGYPAGYTSYPAGYRIAEKLPDSAGYWIVTGYPARPYTKYRRFLHLIRKYITILLSNVLEKEPNLIA